MPRRRGLAQPQPQEKRSSVFNRLNIGAAERSREVDGNLIVRVSNTGSRIPGNRSLLGSQRQDPLPLEGEDLRAKINARKGERQTETGLKESGHRNGGEKRKIGDALASRLGKRKTNPGAEDSLERGGSKVPSERLGFEGQAERRIATGPNGLPKVTIRSPKEVYCDGCTAYGHELSECKKQRTGPGNLDGVGLQSHPPFLCPICDVVCNNLSEHIKTVRHKRADSRQRATRTFTCQLCDEQFSGQEALSRHVMSGEHKGREEQRIWQEQGREELDRGRALEREDEPNEWSPERTGNRRGENGDRGGYGRGPVLRAERNSEYLPERERSFGAGREQDWQENGVRFPAHGSPETRKGQRYETERESESPPRQSLSAPRGKANGRAKSLELWERSGQKRKAGRFEGAPPGTATLGYDAYPEDGAGASQHMRMSDDDNMAKRPRQGQRDEGRYGAMEENQRERSISEAGDGFWRKGELREAEVAAPQDDRRAQHGVEERGNALSREGSREQRSSEVERRALRSVVVDEERETRVQEPVFEGWPGEDALGDGGANTEEEEESGEGFAGEEENGLEEPDVHDAWLELRLAPTHVTERQAGLANEGLRDEAPGDREAREELEGAKPQRKRIEWGPSEEESSEGRKLGKGEFERGAPGGERRTEELEVGGSARRASLSSRLGGRGQERAAAGDYLPPGFRGERADSERSDRVEKGTRARNFAERGATGRMELSTDGRQIVNGRTGPVNAGVNPGNRSLQASETQQEHGRNAATNHERTETAERNPELARKAKERRTQTGKVIRGEVPRGLRADTLDDEGFEVSLRVAEAMERGVSLPELEAPLSMDNYYERMAMLYHVEEAQMQLDIMEFDQVVTLRTSGSGLLFEVPGLAERKPSVAKGDKMLLSKGRGGGPGSPKYLVYAHDVDLGKRAIFTQQAYLDPDRDYFVQFFVRREPIVRAVRSLQLCRSAVGSELQHLFFPGPVPDHLELATLPRFEPRDTDLNTEQRLVIASIVQRTIEPQNDVPPFVIFGPPGTGKTKTMVGTIVEVRKVRPEARLLVCAPSNSAADNLLEQLFNSSRGDISRGDFKADIVRVNSPARPKEGVGALPPALADFTMYDPSSGFYKVPTPHARSPHVFITTCSAASLLQKNNFPRGYFSHIFIDEAGHAVEPECFVPLACFATRGTVVALAGDHHQLGPVVRSPLARKHGLGTSYLERLCGLPLYRPEDENGRYVGYRGSVIRKLVRNYRSHPDILQIPSDIFYHGELDASADEEARQSLCNWRELPTKGFPIILHGLASADDREGDSPSWYNEGEMKQVLFYIDRLLLCRTPRLTHFDIGVVAPYRRQVQRLQRLLEAKGRAGIRVGTVEEFQGQEKRVVIVTSVRAEHGADGEPRDVPGDVRRGLGFLGNRKRFNVAMTRAKELLIIIGNPHVLKQDPLWARMLRYCISRGGYQSKHCPPPPNEEIDALVEAAGGLANGSAEDSADHEGHMESPEWPEPV